MTIPFQISVASLHSVFELLRQVSLSAPALLSSVISTTDQCIQDLPQKCFTGKDLAAGQLIEEAELNMMMQFNYCRGMKPYHVAVCILWDNSGLFSGTWLDFLKDISVSSTDKRTFKVLLCVAILQNRADLILSAIRHTLKAKIPDIEAIHFREFVLNRDFTA